MNSNDVIICINNIEDIKKISENTKYINIDILNVDIKVIDYFLLHGQNYLYSDIINGKNGFIYSNYDMFKSGETIISNIIDSMPSNLTEIEIIRYLYICLGRIVNVDINVIDEKNSNALLSCIGTVCNLWSAITIGKITNISICKLFMYLCARMKIKCELICNSIKGGIANKVYSNDTFLIVDLYNDIYNIQGNFITKFFDKYNNEKDMDRKIFYIKEEYMNYYFDKVFDGVDLIDDTIYKILSLMSNVLNIKNIGTVELSKICNDIFNKYLPNYDIKINNFFINRDNFSREHFLTIGYNGNYYSFSYNRNTFINISYDYLEKCLKENTIGLYEGEDFSLKDEVYAL